MSMQTFLDTITEEDSGTSPVLQHVDSQRRCSRGGVTLSCVRFDDLFDDLESQLEAGLDGSARELAAEEERFRLGRLSMQDRLLRGDPHIELRLRGGARLRIARIAVGRDWVSGNVTEGAGLDDGCIVPFTAILGVRLSLRQVSASIDAVEPPPRLTARLSFAFALRDLARRRATVELRGAGEAVTGTIDRVGRDHCDIAVHDRGEARSQRAVRYIELVPFQAIDWVRLGD